MRQLAIGTSQNYPTQYSEELPAELISSATIRQLDSITVRNFKSFRKRQLLFREGTLYRAVSEVHQCRGAEWFRQEQHLGSIILLHLWRKAEGASHRSKGSHC